MVYLTLPELLHVAERTLGPDYAVRDYGLLEAALDRPRATAFGEDAYPDLDAKVAALLHSIACNHALIDGNKQLALAAIISFYGLRPSRPPCRPPPSHESRTEYTRSAVDGTGNLASALGYAGFAFAGRSWQAFVCSAVGGTGFGLANTANQVLSLTLVTAEQRASSIALRRVAGNFGLGSGATVAGFIVASANHLRAFQALYLFDGLTFAAFALVVHVGIPNPRRANAAPAGDRGTSFRAVAHDRFFLILIAANIVLVMTGGALFSNRRPDTGPALAGALPSTASRQRGRHGPRLPQPDE